ncbi:polyprenyl synthetase family protein [Chitinophaga sp. OAE865]|uniref:polyprenyl synthetase family protein n=1 Tax=Chitinophaga sp. OAE865 TaxID=2817898 RepID=UPI001AE99FAA
MNSLNDLIVQYNSCCSQLNFPEEPHNLYSAIRYFLEGGGKRIRPVLCLLGNELFGDIHQDSFHAGNAIELFHNCSLVHDDIMDHSPLRRGKQTIHVKYNVPTAILTGDVLLVNAFQHISNVQEQYKQQIHALFSATILQICEGQQMDVDFEKMDLDQISFPDYLKMIILKTSVLLAASIKIGAIIGGADLQQQAYLYDFGKNLGIAFQIQDDYLDAFGEPSVTGKQPGGDILENKKTALLIKAWERSTSVQKKELLNAMSKNKGERVAAVLEIYKGCKVDEWATGKISQYTATAFNCLDMVDVPFKRKENLLALTNKLLVRQS